MHAQLLDNSSRNRRQRGGSRVRVAVVGILLGVGLVVLTAGPASAAGTLSSISWTVSNSQTSKTSVTYAYAFKTASSGTIASVTMTSPTGTGLGSIAVGTVYGLGAGTVSTSGTTIKYTVTSPVSVSSGISIYISFTGITNTSTAGSYTSTITTQTSAPATIDSGTSGSVTFGSSSTGVTVTVGKTLTFTNNTPSFTLAVDPTMLNNVESQTVTLTVLTNAVDGYTLSASDTGLSQSSPSYTIPAVSSGPTTGVASFPADGFGVSATLSGGGSDGATLAAGFSGGDWVGYPSASANFLTTTSATGATADTLTLTDQVAVNYAVPDGTYTDTITYVATPTF